MSILVVGSVAYDSIKTPRGHVDRALGGSAVYFSLAARLSSPWPVRLVGAVGDDFPRANVDFLDLKGIDTAGLEVVRGGKTFRWEGEYAANMNDRRTLSVELNVLGDFRPRIPDAFRDSRFVFLANGPPATQLGVLDQVDHPDFVMADTMDLWIQTTKHELLALLRRVDVLLVNDSEALLLTEQPDVIRAGLAILELGPSRVIVKKGEHGVILFAGDEIIPLPAYPVRDVIDPTGAGDSFAGGLVGRLAASAGEPGQHGRPPAAGAFKEALAYGAVVASFTVEGFGVGKLAEARASDVRDRYQRYRSWLAL